MQASVPAEPVNLDQNYCMDAAPGVGFYFKRPEVKVMLTAKVSIPGLRMLRDACPCCGLLQLQCWDVWHAKVMPSQMHTTLTRETAAVRTI